MNIPNMETPKSSGMARSRIEEIEIVRAIFSEFGSSPDNDKLAEQLISRFGDASTVLLADETELTQVLGISNAVICHLRRMRHLVRGFARLEISNRPLLDNLNDVKRFCRTILGAKRREEFHVLFLDSGYHLIGHEVIQTGTLNHVSIYPRELMHRALSNFASHLILIHNHPTDLSEPSPQDVTMTHHLAHAGRYLDITILDHIIIGRDGDFSFRQKGMLNLSKVPTQPNEIKR